MIAVMSNSSNTMTIDISLENQLIKTSAEPPRHRDPTRPLDARDT